MGVYYGNTQINKDDPIIVASFELGEKKTFNVDKEILFVRNQIKGEYSDVYAKHNNGDEKETILQNYEVVIKKQDVDYALDFKGNEDLDINKSYLLIAKDKDIYKNWH